MTALSIINMRQSSLHPDNIRDFQSIKLNKLERLGVRLQVARSLQKQTNWEQIVCNGEQMETNIFFELMDICNNDPAHVAKVQV